MDRILLITFGCSWTYGVGVNYDANDDRQIFEKNSWNQQTCDQLSWRGLLSQKYNLTNRNLSEGGSSNQRQFRRAKYYFSSDLFQVDLANHERIIVLWGITSTARSEIYSVEQNSFYNFFYSSDDKFSKFMFTNCYDHDIEVFNLRMEMLHWDRFFQSVGIENFWFDTFNTHDYTNIPESIVEIASRDHYDSIKGPDWPAYDKYVKKDFGDISIDIVQEIKLTFLPVYLDFSASLSRLIDYDLSPRDLMSWLAKKHGILVDTDQYHHSSRMIDCDHMPGLIDNGILNPYTYHPTKLGHREICEFFSEKVFRD